MVGCRVSNKTCKMRNDYDKSKSMKKERMSVSLKGKGTRDSFGFDVQ